MGLDTVELVMEFEDQFDISISDDDAEKMQTVGDTFDYIVRKLSRKLPVRRGVCASARMFYELRNDLHIQFGVPRPAVRPGSRIADLIPAGNARSSWGEFARDHGLPRPPFAFFPSHRFPPPETTLRELIENARPTSPIDFLWDDGSLDTKLIWEKIRKIVAHQMGVSLDQIHPHTHYVHDLNC